ncbi:MAG: glutamate 5-kinase [Alphaproteobacteria bacterium]|nr:glutamate 5-kinase [Alphaproteobacteria bacterium]
MPNTQDILRDADTIVFKIGSAILTNVATGQVNQEWLESFVDDIREIRDMGKKIVIVSSGAVALGRIDIGIAPDQRPSEIPLELKQAAAAVGQFYLFNAYFDELKKDDMKAAQILLTMSETEDWRMHLNARETITTLLDRGIIPIINENDTISTGEIRFGDNDKLAVRVGQMVEADAVVLLSTTDGLYRANPDVDPTAPFIPVVKTITENHVSIAGDAVAGLSTGGMKSKIEAAISATRAGIHLIITDGVKNGSLNALMHDPDKKNTLFTAEENRANARKTWIQSHLNPKGSVFVDEGAEKALDKGNSLLPIGVKSIDGEFDRGDVILIKNQYEETIGIGIAAFPTNELFMIIGRQSDDIPMILGYAGRTEVIHRNDLVLYDDPLQAIPNADH